MVDRKVALPKTFFPFIAHFLADFKPVVFFFIFLSLSAGLWGPFNSILFKYVINLLPEVQDGDVSILILPISLIIVNFVVFDNLTRRGVAYIRCQFVPVIINRVIAQTMDYVLGKSQQFYQDNLTGKISKQISNLADGIEKLLSSVAFNFLKGSSLLLTAFIASYLVNPVFCFILVTWSTLFTAVSISMSKKLVSLSDKQASAESIVIGELVDSLSNQGNVRIFSRKAHEHFRMNPYLRNNKKAYKATYFYALIMHSVQGGLIAVMLAFSAYFLVFLYSKNLVTVGDFALILGLCIETGHMTWYTMSEVNDFNKEFGRCKQSLQALTIPLEIQDSPDAKPLQCHHGQILFDNVVFQYHGSKPLLKHHSIKINAKQKVGLVGNSGGGKSTFVNLIMRIYDVSEGHILIDDQNVKDVTQDSLRKNISMIPQDPSLFNRSLMENIRYGRIAASDEEVIEAAKKAHAHDFICRLPEGYNTLVGERGLKLSGGQRQRIAIARAILKNAPILILDEATSQLDSVTESLIQESLMGLMQNKTTLIIAHRLSTLLNMDRILVFDKGHIVEDGNHYALLAKSGLYKQLWDAQVGGFLGHVHGQKDYELSV